MFVAPYRPTLRDLALLVNRRKFDVGKDQIPLKPRCAIYIAPDFVADNPRKQCFQSSDLPMPCLCFRDRIEELKPCTECDVLHGLLIKTKVCKKPR